MKKALFILVISAFLIEALFPFQLSPIKGISLKNIATYLALLILFVTEIGGGGIRKKKIPGLVFLIIIIIGASFQVLYIQASGKAPISSLQHLIFLKLWIYDPFILYFIIFLLIDDEKQGQQALFTVVIVFSMINVISLVASKMGLHLFIELDVSNLADSENRFAGAYKNANQMAYFLCFLMPFLYYFYKQYKGIAIKSFIFCLMISGIISIMLSGSRGGTLALAMCFGAIIVIYKDFKFGFTLLSFAVLFLVISFFSGNEYVTKTVDRVSVLLEGDIEKASSYRFVIWQNYFELLTDKKHNIFTGTGLGIERILMQKRIGIDASSHNFYLQILVEFGIIGLLIWILTVARVLSIIIMKQTNDSLLLKKIILVSLSIIFFGWCFSELVTIIKYLSIVFSAALAYFIQKTNQELKNKVA